MWREVRLTMHAYGVQYDLAFLRSLDWLEATGAAPGREIHLSLPEMGLDGPALVESIAPCPPLEPAAGLRHGEPARMLVTGTMRHLAGNILDVSITGLDEPLGVTDTHPIWSETRQDFVTAGQLEVGEHLRSETGTLAQVTRITPRRGPPESVYNLEIDGEHVYQVSHSGLLVHNACSWDDFKVGEHALKPDHNWSKLFGSNKPTLDQIRPYLDDVLDNGTWQKVGDAHGKGGKIIGELLQAEHNGIWVRAVKDLSGKIIVNNGGVL